MLFGLPVVYVKSVLEYYTLFVLVFAYGSFVGRYAKWTTKCVEFALHYIFFSGFSIANFY